MHSPYVGTGLGSGVGNELGTGVVGTGLGSGEGSDVGPGVGAGGVWVVGAGLGHGVGEGGGSDSEAGSGSGALARLAAAYRTTVLDSAAARAATWATVSSLATVSAGGSVRPKGPVLGLWG